MKRTTTIYGMKSLTNLDFQLAYSLIESMFKEEEFDAEDVQVAHKGIVAQQEELETIDRVNFANHMHTAEMERLKEMRKRLAQQLKERVKFGLKTPIASEREAANMLYAWIEKESEFLKSSGIKDQIESVARIKQEVALMPELMEHSSTLRLDGVIESLIGTTCEIDETSRGHKAVQMEERARAKSVRQEAYKAMQQFLAALIVEANKEEKGGEGVYNSSLEIIEYVVKEFKTREKSRKTRKRNKKMRDKN